MKMPNAVTALAVTANTKGLGLAALWLGLIATTTLFAGCGGSNAGPPAPPPPPAVPNSGPPQIVTQLPASYSMQLGHPVAIGVMAGGEAPLRYQWRRNGVDIAGATSAQYTIPDHAFAPQSEVYAVEVSNAQGSVVGTPLTLNVLPAQSGPAVDRVRSIAAPMADLIRATKAGNWATITETLTVVSALPGCQSGSRTLEVNGAPAIAGVGLPVPAGQLASVFRDCEIFRGAFDDGSVAIAYTYARSPGLLNWFVQADVRDFRRRRNSPPEDTRVDGSLRRDFVFEETRPGNGSTVYATQTLYVPTPGATYTNLLTSAQATIAGGSYGFSASWDENASRTPAGWTADGLTIVVGPDTYVFSGTSSAWSAWEDTSTDGRRIRLTRNGEHVADLSQAEEEMSFIYTVYRRVDGV